MKIHIIGCSGTGKTYLAKKLSNKYNIPHYDLDNIHWDNSSEKYGIKTKVEKRDKLLKNILENIPKERKSFAYDWYWSHKLQEEGTPVMVSEQSLLQHIGVEGQNNKEIKGIDIGLNFTPTNTDDLEFLLHHYEIVISNFAKQNDKYVFFSRNNFFIKHVIIFYRFIKSLKRKIFDK